MPEVEVLIVGGGPTGLAAANALGQLGVEAMLVEQEPGVAELPRAVSVDDEAMRFMQWLGLAEAMRDIVLPGTGTKFYGRHGQLLAYSQGPPAPLNGQPIKNPIDHSEFQLALLRGLDRYPRVDVRHRARFTGFEARPDGILATIEAEGETETVKARYLLGADGGRSVVRTLIGQEPMTGSAFAERWLVVDTVDDHHDERYAMHYGDPMRPRVVVVGRGGRCRYEFLIDEDEDPSEDEVSRLAIELVSSYRSLTEDDVVRAAIYKFYALVADEFCRDRVFIMGDAAHMMPPFAGQGLNSGLRDAANLCWKLAARVQGRAGTELLDSYTLERQPHVRATVALSVRLGAIMMTRSRARAAARDAIFAICGRFPPGRRRLAKLLSRPPTLHRRGFVVEPSAPLAGGILTQSSVIDAAGHIVGLDDVLGDAFALLGVEVEPRCFADLAASIWDQLAPKHVHLTLDHRLPAAQPELNGIADFKGALAAQLEPVRGRFVLVRPDRIVAGSFAPAEEGRFAERLAPLLGRAVTPAAHAGG